MKSMSDANEALQNATRDGEWVYWRGEAAHLANSHHSVYVGELREGVDELLDRLPMCERALDMWQE